MDNNPFDNDPRSFDPAGEAAAGVRQQNVFLLVHRRLRGRYHWAALAAILLSLPFAFLGYKARKPKFESTGIIQIEATRPVVLTRTEENEVPPNFDAMVQTEARLITSNRTLSQAVDKYLADAPWPSGPLGVAQLQRVLRVSAPRGGQLIEISVPDTDPVVAQLAVNAVLKAYQELRIEKSDRAQTSREQQLVDRERTLRSELDTLRKRQLTLSEEQSAESLVVMHKNKVQQIDQLEQEIRRLDFAIGDAEARGGRPAPAGDDLEALLRFVAPGDAKLSALQDLAGQIKSDIRSYETRYGPNHRAITKLRGDLAAVEEQIRQRVESIVSANAGEGGAPNTDLSQYTVVQLKELRNRYVSLRDGARAEAADLNSKAREIEALDADIQLKNDQLAQTITRLDTLRVELQQAERQDGSASRMSVAQWGELDTIPDDKRLMTAAAGAMFGAFLGVAAVFGLSLLDRGYRYIDDVEHDAVTVPLLGTLPDLAARTPAQEELAALSVHHLRNALQLHTAPPSAKGARVWTITSAAAGDGKTSLCLALGMSFAVSGQRTLLFDSDLVGRGLTRELNLDREHGLCQVAADGQVAERVRKMQVENLWALTAGVPDLEARNLSRATMEKIVASIREQFDVVIVDTGPVLGSLEANLVASLSDGVVITISRGQSGKFVAACLERLRRIGAPVAGLVFNRASAADFLKNVSAGSVCSQSLRPPKPGESPRDFEARRSARGALVRAVAGAESQPPQQRNGAAQPASPLASAVQRS